MALSALIKMHLYIDMQYNLVVHFEVESIHRGQTKFCVCVSACARVHGEEEMRWSGAAVERLLN